jgi:hypothetical protein
MRIVISIPSSLSTGMSPGDIVGHFLAGRYVTHQFDGVHVEARCTCGVKLEGVGIDAGAALDPL